MRSRSIGTASPASGKDAFHRVPLFATPTLQYSSARRTARVFRRFPSEAALAHSRLREHPTWAYFGHDANARFLPSAQMNASPHNSDFGFYSSFSPRASFRKHSGAWSLVLDAFPSLG